MARPRRHLLPQKALAAHDAGAVAVIISNYDEDHPDDVPVLPSGSSVTVDIPVVLISYNEGARASSAGTPVALFDNDDDDDDDGIDESADAGGDGEYWLRSQPSSSFQIVVPGGERRWQLRLGR